MFRLRPFAASALGLLVLLLFAAGCSGVRHKAVPETTAAAEELLKLRQLNTKAEEVYRKTNTGEVVEARSLLSEMAQRIPSIRFNGITSVDGLDALTGAMTEAIRAYNAVSFSTDTALAALTKLRLATDALVHPDTPMWLQYYKVIGEDIRKAEESLQGKQNSEALKAFASFQGHYATIRPAARVNREPWEVERADSLATALQNLTASSEWSYSAAINLVRQTADGMDNLFHKKDSRSAYLPLADARQTILWTLGVAGCILTALGYTGWRMFRSGVSTRVRGEDEIRRQGYK